MPARPDRRAPRPKRPSSVADRISAAGARLTATDRKVAAMVAALDNVRRTLEAATPAVYGDAVRRLADRRRPVAILAGDAAGPVGSLLADQLDQLRPGVARLAGSPVAVARQLAGLGDDAV